MEGILAVGGFWLCMIAIVLKKPFMQYIEKTKTQQSDASQLLEARVLHLEGAVSALGTSMTDLKDSTEFAQKMIIESSKKLADSHQLLIDSTRKLAASQQPLIQDTPVQVQVVPTAAVQPAPAPAPAPVPALAPPAPPRLPNNQSDLDASLGKIISDDTIRFERTVPANIERVWQYISQPEFLSSWLAVANIEPKVGGRVELHFDHDWTSPSADEGTKVRGLVSAFEPQRKLSYSWIDTAGNLESSVSIDLTSHSDQTAVVVTHSRLPQDRIQQFLAAWHTHLDILVARLKNAMPPSFPKRYRELIQTYAMVAAAIVVASAGPASASSSSDNVYQTVQAERNHLLAKYDSVWKDADELQRRIDALKRENTEESSRTLGRLDSALQNEYRDLHEIELEIRDMNRALN